MSEKAAFWAFGFCVAGTLALFVFVIAVLPADQQANFMREDGPVEMTCAILYFVCALLMLGIGGRPFIAHYHHLAMLAALFGAREMDFHKEFTTMSVLKSRFYVSDTVPMWEKLIGVVVILTALYVLVRMVKLHARTYLTKIGLNDPFWVGGFLVAGMLGTSKTLDGLARKLNGWFSITLDESIYELAGIAEEVLELGAPAIMVVMAIHFRHRWKNGMVSLDGSNRRAA